MRRAKLRVAPYPHSATSPWCIEGLRVSGKRKRLFFQTKTAAEAELARIRTRIAFEGQGALELSDATRMMALEAQRNLLPYGKTLADAVSFYLKHLEASRRSITVEALVAEFLGLQERLNRTKVHRSDLRSRYTRFCLKFGKHPVGLLGTKEISSWLRGLHVSPVSYNNYRARVGILFGYAVKQGYLEKNPCEAIENIEVGNRPPEILTVEQLARLLLSATPESLPVLCLGAFSGLRTSELLRLSWEDFDLKRGFLNIGTLKNKGPTRRCVKMEPNLIAWLSPFAGRTGALWPRSVGMLHHLMKPVRMATGRSRWPANCLRHTFASHHFAKYQDAARLALDLGHHTTKMVFSNYQKLVRPDEAERYFSIFPPAEIRNESIARPS
jgi:integrase